MIEIQGGIPDLQGTWVHIQVALNLAAWVSPELEVWAYKALLSIINGDYRALTAEAEEAMRRVQKLWQEVRDSGIEIRKDFTQSIKDSYLKRHPEADKVPFWEYSNPSDLLNVLLTGYPAKYWRDRLGFTTDELLRNNWGIPHLKRIERVEALAQVFVEEEGMEPVDAIKHAVKMFRCTVWSEDELLGKNDAKTRDRNRKRKSSRSGRQN